MIVLAINQNYLIKMFDMETSGIEIILHNCWIPVVILTEKNNYNSRSNTQNNISSTENVGLHIIIIISADWRSLLDIGLPQVYTYRSKYNQVPPTALDNFNLKATRHWQDIPTSYKHTREIILLWYINVWLDFLNSFVISGPQWSVSYGMYCSLGPLWFFFHGDSALFLENRF